MIRPGGSITITILIPPKNKIAGGVASLIPKKKMILLNRCKFCLLFTFLWCIIFKLTDVEQYELPICC
jgi:hypothetical protein